MEEKKSDVMTTLSSVLNTLLQRGYVIDYNKDPFKEELLTNYKNYRIEKTYRFEGITNPEDESILYSIVSVNGDKKGVLVNGYGTSSDETINRIVENLTYKKS